MKFFITGFFSVYIAATFCGNEQRCMAADAVNFPSSHTDWEYVSRYPIGAIYEGVVRGNVAYISKGAEIEIWDITQKKTPRHIYTISLDGVVEKLFLQDAMLAVTCGYVGVYWFDVSQPRCPRVVARVPAQEYMEWIGFEKGKWYISDGYTVCIFDLSEHAHPRKIRECLIHMRDNIEDIVLKEGSLYLGSSTKGIWQIKGLDTLTPQETLYSACNAYSLAVYEDKMYVGSADQGALIILNRNAPTIPQAIIPHAVGGLMRQMQIQDERLFCFGDFKKAEIFDIKNPLTPRHIASVSLPQSETIQIVDEVLYVFSPTEGVTGFDIRNLPDIKKVMQCGYGEELHSFSLEGDDAFLVVNNGQCKQLDISHPYAICEKINVTAPGVTTLTAFKTQWLAGRGHKLGLYQNQKAMMYDKGRLITECADTIDQVEILSKGSDIYGYVRMQNSGIEIFKFDAKKRGIPIRYIPEGPFLEILVQKDAGFFVRETEVQIWDLVSGNAPSKIQHISCPGKVNGIASKGTLLFIACGQEGVLIYDVTNLKNPRYVSCLAAEQYTYSVHGEGDCLYVGDGNAIFIFDISDLSCPHKIGRVFAQADAEIRDIEFAGQRLYVACGPAGFCIVDRTDKEHPRIIREWSYAGPVNLLCQDYPYLFIGIDQKGISVIDTTDESLFHEEGYYQIPASLYDMDLGEHTLYVSTSRGLHKVWVDTQVKMVRGMPFYPSDKNTSLDKAFLKESSLREVDKDTTKSPAGLPPEQMVRGLDIAYPLLYAAIQEEEHAFVLCESLQTSMPAKKVQFAKTGVIKKMFVSKEYLDVWQMTPQGAGMRVIKISDPCSFEEMGFFFSKECLSICRTDRAVYVGCGRSLYVIPSGIFVPSLLSHLPEDKKQYVFPSLIKDIRAIEQGGYVYLYILLEEQGIWVIRMRIADALSVPA